ncbi:MAG: RNA polymerase sigma factor [Acidimicrobiia bacterium]
MGSLALVLSGIVDARAAGVPITVESEALVIALFHAHGRDLVRLARVFVDDREAAEDLVQEAYIRLARHAARIADQERAPAYLRSIVLNLARDHNRRGLVSFRHQLPTGRDVDVVTATDDQVVALESNRTVLDAVRALPARQRDCITLRYYVELGIGDIARTLGVSENSVKTHLKRGLANLEARLGDVR